MGDQAHSRPPRLARDLLRRALPVRDAEFVLGDLEEQYSRLLEGGKPRWRAELWFWREALLATWSERGGLHVLDSLTREARFAVRSLAARPTFTLTAVLTIALGVGPTLAILALVNSTLLRPLPFREPERLVFVWSRLDRAPGERVRASLPDVTDLREATVQFDAFAATDNLREAALEPIGGEPEAIHLGRVTSNFFQMLGVSAAAGSLFDPALGNGADGVAGLVLSDDLWRRRFGADPEVVGRTVLLNGASLPVRGVLAPDFALRLPPDLGLPTSVDAWIAMGPGALDRSQARDPLLRDQDSDDSGVVIGRLRPNATLASARDDVARLATSLRERIPAYRTAGVRYEVEALAADGVRHVRPLLIALAAGAALVLIAAAMNVAQLLLLHGLRRTGETSVRIALGASRGRLVIRALIEASLLAALGSAAGLVLAQPVARLLQGQAPTALAAQPPEVSGRSGLVLALSLWALLSLVLAIGPALRASRAHDAGGSRVVGSSRGQVRVREKLVTAQVATASVLLLAALLLLRSVSALGRVNPGFQTNDVLTFQLSLRDPAKYRGPADRNLFTEALEARITALPGVAAVGMGTVLPLSGQSWTNPFGRAGEPPETWLANEADFRMVTPGYLDALGVPLLAGRFLTRADDAESSRVILVDEALARTLVGQGERPEEVVGRRLAFPLDGKTVEAGIVGVIGTVRNESLMEPGRATFYVPYRHEASRSVTVVVRSQGPAEALVPSVRAAVAAVDPHLPPQAIRTVHSYVADAFAPVRFALLLLGAFALTAVALSAVALYGAVSYAVSSRRREMGVRLALGESTENLVRRVVRSALGRVWLGMLAGAAAAIPFAFLLRRLLYGVSPFDPAAWIVAAAALPVLALIACAGPARRITRLTPVEALRRD